MMRIETVSINNIVNFIWYMLITNFRYKFRIYEMVDDDEEYDCETLFRIILSLALLT